MYSAGQRCALLLWVLLRWVFGNKKSKSQSGAHEVCEALQTNTGRPSRIGRYVCEGTQAGRKHSSLDALIQMLDSEYLPCTPSSSTSSHHLDVHPFDKSATGQHPSTHQSMHWLFFALSLEMEMW